MKNKQWAVTGISIAMAFMALACGSGETDALSDSGEVSGDLSLDGTSSAYQFTALTQDGEYDVVVDPETVVLPLPEDATPVDESGGDVAENETVGKICMVVETNNVTAAWVSLNDKDIFRPNSFKKSVTSLKAEISLEESNSLAVKLAGKPGSNIVVAIYENCETEDQKLLSKILITRLKGAPNSEEQEL